MKYKNTRYNQINKFIDWDMIYEIRKKKDKEKEKKSRKRKGRRSRKCREGGIRDRY